MTLPAAEVQRYVHAEFADGLCGAFDDVVCVYQTHPVQRQVREPLL
jgi:hypothetical protein